MPCRTGTSAAAATASGAEDKRDPDKLDAYWTLYECLLTTAKIIAPFVPFFAEAIWQNLSRPRAAGRGPQSTSL